MFFKSVMRLQNIIRNVKNSYCVDDKILFEI